MSRRIGLLVALAVGGVLLLGAMASLAIADSGSRFEAKRMLGVFEVPAVSSPGATGRFEASLDGTTVDYTLSYSGLGSSVTQAHIHVAQPFASGGISVWLCETDAVQHPNVALRPVTPTCPTAGEVSDSFDAAEIVGPAGQGIAATEFGELLAMMRQGLTYANVHTTTIGSGEIRGQLKAHGGDGEDD